MRGWVSLLVVGVTVLAAVAVVAAAVRTQPATAATGPVAFDLMGDLPADAPRAAPPSRAASSIRFPYEAQREWLALPTTNHWEGRRGVAIEYVVIHYTDISYARTLRAFNTRSKLKILSK